MKEVLEFIKLFSTRNDYNLDKLSNAVSRIYFLHIKKWKRSLKKSYEAKMAGDILKIDQGLQKKTLKNIQLETDFFKEETTLNIFMDNEKLEEYEIAQVSDILHPYRFYVDAVMIAEIIKKESNKERFRWFFAIILSIITTVLGVLLKVIGDIYVKLN